MNVKDLMKDGKVVGKDYQYKNEENTLVKKDVKICGKEILSCCQGEFPKSSWVDNFNLGNFDNQPEEVGKLFVSKKWNLYSIGMD